MLYFNCIHYPDGDPDHSQNGLGSKLDQDPSSDFVHQGPTSSNCVIQQIWKSEGCILKYQPL